MMMIQKNPLNWKTTSSKDSRMLYLTIMRNIKEYCAKGYCEVSVTFCNFVELPHSLICRILTNMNLSPYDMHIIVNWSDYDSVHTFYRRFISMLCQLNGESFDSKAFNEAIDEFTQYITKCGNKRV